MLLLLATPVFETTTGTRAAKLSTIPNGSYRLGKQRNQQWFGIYPEVIRHKAGEIALIPNP